MTANEVFKRMLEDPALKEKYKLSDEVLKKTELHGLTNSDILEIIKHIVNGVANDTSRTSVYSQIKSHFKL